MAQTNDSTNYTDDLGMSEVGSPGRPKQDFGLPAEGAQEKEETISPSISKFLSQVFPNCDPKLAKVFVGHCFKALNNSERENTDEFNDEVEFMLSIIRDMSPQDAVERMLAVQMAATHIATMRAARWLSRSERLDQGKIHSTAYAKLARTFTTQVEMLRKHRNGGQQVVTVQHVNVEKGGQAIVGSVQTGGRGNNEK